ncbi:MAG: S24 family peptidase [Hyphomicrobiales bacterium]|nr:S24 family peptidase [Hyphomicrobiales bacterium]
MTRFDIQASAGAGSLVSTDQPNGLVAVDRDWLSRYVSRSANVGVIEASGDSMLPTISNRDLLLVEVKEGATAEEIMRGGIYVLTLDGGLVVKRLEIDGSELVLISGNLTYPEVRITFAQIENRVIIHGVVFWSGGALETHR